MDKHQRHLGDGVYVSFDGFHINLAVNHHENHVIALEPAVLIALEDYIAQIRELVKSKLNEDIESKD